MKCEGLYDDTVSIIVGGEAGQGVNRAGELLGKALMRAGFYCYGNIEYPSLIRGGHNYYQLRTSSRKVHSQTWQTDMLVALNKDTVLKHLDEMNSGGGIIHDKGIKFEKGEITRDDLEFYPIPMKEIVKELEGPDIMINTVALGGTAALIGLDTDYLKEVIAEAFEGKEEIIEMNKRAVQRGYDHCSDNKYSFSCTMESGGEVHKIWLTGNQAVALGAITAGCKFYSAYPMTPASPILHYMIDKQMDTDMVVIQPESEIAAMLMTIGAGYGGVRSMTATSGGGFCLMSEGLSLAALSETPIVVVLAQRPGPSTGMATYSAQGDLLFAVFGAHGEFQRVVLSPSDVDECYYLSAEAFNLAERFQVPVIIIAEKTLLESHYTTDPFDYSKVKVDRGKLIEEWDKDDEYKRYLITEDGVSPRAFPGTENALVFANSNEHKERGWTTADTEPVVEMVDKRFSKEPHIRDAVMELDPIRVHGHEEPDITLIGWGGVKGPCLEAIKLLEDEDVKARYVTLTVMEPFPEGLDEYLKGKTMLLETNKSSVLGTLIKLNTGYVFENTFNKYDGRPFNPDEVAKKVKEAL
ncbi:2-oxoacid:acceptor oxidoreductase subunit alpha [Candidatus Bathyarchaeota archaeon]|nr:2-oxoacid:acceptor oxidoreductase subunit alpha [Candidatus Bathyarchaeota archaeon]